MNIISFSNLLSLIELQFRPKQCPQILKILSLEAWVEVITKIKSGHCINIISKDIIFFNMTGNHIYDHHKSLAMIL